MDVWQGIGGSRLDWGCLPPRVRGGIEDVVGARVIAAQSKPGGFSPGLAARLRLSDGRRVFAKAMSDSPNPTGPRLLRREAEVLDGLPAGLPVAYPIGHYDDGDWVALLLSDIDGDTPVLPWRPQELNRVLAAVHTLGEALTPSPIPAPTVAELLVNDFAQWRALTERPSAVERLPDWVGDHLDLLAALEHGWADAAAGHTLLHMDLRADNVLLTGEQVVIVDWPHAAIGANWIDPMCMVPSIAMQDGGDPETLWQRLPYTRTIDRRSVNAVLAALTGFFLVNSLKPPPPGLPRLREFQRRQGEFALSWLENRLS
ncbi:phosphotransferase family protein [Nocardia nepalensis]|uniref:phosphotransferase family protein n=1 Tax=Nocardia nepalensis TaxID=3375448 RepID=UPI003B677B46